jgi:hypothetical protein
VGRGGRTARRDGIGGGGVSRWAQATPPHGRGPAGGASRINPVGGGAVPDHPAPRPRVDSGRASTPRVSDSVKASVGVRTRKCGCALRV